MQIGLELPAGTDGKVSDVDGLPYSTLLYGNGPGYSEPRSIPINTTIHAKPDKNAVHGAAVPRQWATHGGEDVPVYAQVCIFITCSTSRSIKFPSIYNTSIVNRISLWLTAVGKNFKSYSTGYDNNLIGIVLFQFQITTLLWKFLLHVMKYSKNVGKSIICGGFRGLM